MSNLDIFPLGNAVEAICNDVCIHVCLVNTTLPNMDMYTQPCRQLVKDLGRQTIGYPGIRPAGPVGYSGPIFGPGSITKKNSKIGVVGCNRSEKTPSYLCHASHKN